MKSIANTIALILMILSTSLELNAQTEPVEVRVDRLLTRMSVEEKVGQMTQIDLNILLDGGYSNNDGELDPAKVDSFLNQHYVGSVLNVVNNAYSMEIWHKLISQLQDAALQTPNSIPLIYGIDTIHGANYISGATLFPHNSGLGASRLPSLVFDLSRAAAYDTRATGISWNFDPVLDIAKNPLWPRYEETYSEDPILVSIMAEQSVLGYQYGGLLSNKSVASTLKHFVGYSNPRSGRDRTPASIPEIELREFDIEPYRASIKAGATAIMVNSGDVNGIPVHGNRYLLTDILRNELGFDGVIVSDWEDVNRIHTRQNIKPTLKEAVRMAVMAGIDMSMTPHDVDFAILLAELYREDAEIATRVDESVARILKLKFELGLFENPYPHRFEDDSVYPADHSELALNAALKTMTLLKNDDHQLPLIGEQRVLVAGPAANNITSLHGSWSYTWQGNRQDVYPKNVESIYQALGRMMNIDRVTTISVPDFNAIANYDTKALIEAAINVDHIILCLGEDAYAESPGSIQDLTLDTKQIALVDAALTTGKPVTVVLISGRPRIINAFADYVKSILMAYRPGSMGAEAIAQTLTGLYNPAGKLPFTYPRYTGDIVPYYHKWTELSVEDEVGKFSLNGYNPQFGFGHGLSYTTFDYSDFHVDKTQFTKGDTVTVQVSVRNTGTLAGDEIVELYSRSMFSSVVPSLRRLRAFERIHLKPNELKTVTFHITSSDLEYSVYGHKHGSYDRILEPGEIHFMIGGLGFEFEDEPSKPVFVSRAYKHAIKLFYVD